MAEIKKISIANGETGLTTYAIVRREADSYRLNDADGSFAAAPADPYLSLTEDSVIKGLYEVSESRAVWDNGAYLICVYEQSGGSPAPASDNIIWIAKKEIRDDLFIFDQEHIGDILTSVNNLSTGSAAISIAAESYNLTTGTQSSGTYANTATVDSVYHEHTDTAGAMELYYQFDVGGAGVAATVSMKGRINGNNDDLDGVYAYNWVTTTWDRIGDFEGVAGSTDSENTFDLLIAHTGTGANLGKVRIRFYAASGLTSATLRIDQIFTSYAVVSQTVGYALGAIWIDTNASNTNTEAYVDGVADNPVSTWAAALTLSAALGIEKFNIAAGSSITLTGNSDSYYFTGQAYSIALNGQSIDGAFFFGANITGIGVNAGVEPVFEDCPIGDVTLPPSIMRRCFFSGTITNSGVGDWFINHCMSRKSGSGARPTFDFGAAIGDTNLNMRLYSGGIQLESMGDTGTDTASIEGNGDVIEGTCTAGAVVIRGNFTLSGVTNLTITDDARYDKAQVADAVWDEILTKATHNIGQSGGKRLRQLAAFVGADATINDATPTSTSFITTLTSTIDDFYNDQCITVTDDTYLIGQSRVVSAYNGTTKEITVDEGFSQAPLNGSDFIIFTPHVHPISQIVDAVWDEPLTGHTTAGTSGLGILKILGLTLENHVEDDIVRDANGNKTGSTLYSYDTAANATTHDKATGLIASYTVTGTYDSDDKMTLLKSLKA